MNHISLIINDQIIPPDHPERQMLLAQAYRSKTRPLCACKPQGIPMYLARLNQDTLLVKRMPTTGPMHDPGCDCYEMPPELSGRGALGQKAIEEDENDGTTKLRLSFSLSKRGSIGSAISPVRGQSAGASSVSADPGKLSARSLLHLLYEEAGLNRWSPRMAGKRNWFVVRKYLLDAAEGKTASRRPIIDSLLIPEMFSVDRKDEIQSRLNAYFAGLKEIKGQQPMGLLVGEVKAIEPARFGQRIVIRHLPDTPIYLADDIYRRMAKNFSRELAFFAEEPEIHLLCICTFTRSVTGNLQADTLCLMTVDGQWLPFENRDERDLIDRYRHHHRYFTKCLRYNLSDDDVLASVLLTDTQDQPTVVYLMPESPSEAYQEKLHWIRANSELPVEVIDPYHQNDASTERT